MPAEEYPFAGPLVRPFEDVRALALRDRMENSVQDVYHVRNLLARFLDGLDDPPRKTLAAIEECRALLRECAHETMHVKMRAAGNVEATPMRMAVPSYLDEVREENAGVEISLHFADATDGRQMSRAERCRSIEVLDEALAEALHGRGERTAFSVGFEIGPDEIAISVNGNGKRYSLGQPHFREPRLGYRSEDSPLLKRSRMRLDDPER